jgi:hypothetical protein
VPPTSRRSSPARPRWPADRRDETVAAALVGMVVILLGYASGIGGGADAAGASAGPPPGTAIVQPSHDATAPAPVIVSATGSSGTASWNGGGAPAGYGGGSGGYGGTSPTGASTSPPSSAMGATSPPVIVSAAPSGSASASATASASASASSSTPASGIGGSGGGPLSCVLGDPLSSSGLTGGLLSQLGTTVGGLLDTLLGSCQPSASASPGSS